MRKITLADRLRYRFDNTISKGTGALIGWLFVVVVVLVFTSSTFIYATGLAPEVHGRRPGFLETLWVNLMRTIDPGNVGGSGKLAVPALDACDDGDRDLGLQHLDPGHLLGHR
jgi:hypothetical protein